MQKVILQVSGAGIQSPNHMDMTLLPYLTIRPGLPQ